MQHSESLLTEILSLLQNLNANVHEFKEKLGALEADIEEYRNHIDGIFERAFPNGLVETHAVHHAKIGRGGIIKRAVQYLDRLIQ